MGHYVYKYVFNDEIIYIGKNDTDLHSRLKCHGRPGDNIPEEGWDEINNSDIFYCILANSNMSDVVESELISRYEPKYNKAKKSKWVGLFFTEPVWIKYEGDKKQYKPKTTKKVKYIETEQFINATTGELQEMQVTSIEDRNFNFAKILMKDYIATTSLFIDQKTKFCYWIIDNLDRDYVLMGTQRDFARESGVSLQTVSITMKLLMDAKLLEKVRNGIYAVNSINKYISDYMQKEQINILHRYRQAQTDDAEIDTAKKIENLKEAIKKLNKQLSLLESIQKKELEKQKKRFKGKTSK